ncbi:MAG: CHAT domain-containing protein [Cyclobacteriaceae bacterium]|nr:CHAT domain-containing protein [Cyclobacteriaceae bacterium]
MNGISQRPLAVGDIEYIYIPQRRSSPSILFPPQDFEHNILHVLGSLPKNLIQLNDPFTHFGNVKMVQTLIPHRFSVYYPDSIPSLLKQNPYKISCKVVFIHPETDKLDEIIKMLLSEFLLVFLIRIDAPDQVLKGYEPLTITNPLDFIQKLTKKKEVVERILLESFPKQQIPFEINLDIKDLHKSYNPRRSFRGCNANYLTLNQTLGNAWIEDEKEIGNQEQIVEETNVLMKNPFDPSRFKLILGQVEKMDELEILVLEDRGIKFPNHKDEWLSSLVLVVPFNYPTLNDIFDPSIEREDLKRWKKALSHEQSLNYVSYTPREGYTQEDVAAQAHLQSSKTSYLDFLGYLHASFTNSTVVRFPQLANSIKPLLSFFKPETINNTKWINSKKLIDNFGNKLSSLIIPDGLDEQLFLIPRQIVAITDLPIEWLIFKGTNLCFHYDVTRIPETPYGGILASFTANAHVQFTVKDNILSKTLIILGASVEDGKDDEFKSYFNTIEKQAMELSCQTARCASVKDVVDQIELHKPDLLIFDCHGGFDPSTYSSYLEINGERLTGVDIVKHKITAPLVFLSACHTNPNYGYLNKIANAFFEAGCLAITATYFPISVYSGSNIYYRLLTNLANAVKLSVHKNWLSFVSHVIRTSFYKEVIYQTQRNVANSASTDPEKAKIINGLNDLNLEIGLNFLKFDLRPNALNLMFEKLNELVPNHLIDRETIPEYIFYTNMGRGDLVRFECWEKKFDELNKHDNRSRYKG